MYTKNTKYVREVKNIEFGIMSTQDILKYSVVEITSSKLSGPNTVYDEKMGPMENNVSCVTCRMNSRQCSGHIGHIVLRENVIHPLYYKYIVSLLKCFCINCHKLLLNINYIKMHKLDKTFKTGESKFKNVLDQVSKIEFCNECNTAQPKIMLSIADNLIYATYKTGSSKVQKKVIINANDILSIFDDITDEELLYLGINAKNTHPRSLILTHLPVISPRSRPFVITDNMVCDDDLTIQYIEIIKVNNHLMDKNLSETKKQKYISTINFRIKCLMDNSHCKSRHTNNRPMRGIRERVAGKSGIIRSHLMGKRVNQSSRTVIGPDVNIPLGWMAVPPEVASILTVPEIVTEFNKDYLLKLINDDKANFLVKGETRINLKYALYKQGTKILPNDVIIREAESGKKQTINVKYDTTKYKLLPGDKLIRNGQEVNDVAYCEKNSIVLGIGNIVERQLKDGDVLYLNRQPTLHTGSMIVQRVKVIPGKTFRFPLAITKSFNADFDGDEMNVHSPLTIEARAELEQIASVEGNYLSSQASTSYISIVQDGVLGTYLLTKYKQKLDKGVWMQLINALGTFSFEKLNHKMNHIRKIYVENGFDPEDHMYTSKTIFSFMLPDDFDYTKKNDAELDEPKVVIKKGVLLWGTINKGQLSGGHSSIVYILAKEYSVRTSMDFVDDVQFVANAFLLWFGFSTGLNDCLVKHDPEDLEKIIVRGYLEAEELEKNVRNASIKESQINNVLTKTKNIGMSISKKIIVENDDIRSSPDNNNFVHLITSGSKGSYFNIAQITTLLGQQSIHGGRMNPQLDMNRTLVHYPWKKLTNVQKYESRGFIKNSFIHGLNPQEFFFHSCSGRQGVIDTSMKTSSTGYQQRKIVKIAEDLCVKYDGTVRDINNKIIQFNYGYNDLDAQKTVMVDDEMQFINVERLATKLNNQYENAL